MHNEGVAGTLLFNRIPLVVEALATACDKFVHPERTKRVFLLRQPRYYSTFNVFIEGENK